MAARVCVCVCNAGIYHNFTRDFMLANMNKENLQLAVKIKFNFMRDYVRLHNATHMWLNAD